ncbi:MAG TPA: hypothetical protein VKA92_12315 [Segetibacter sp.]|nr:hypothetical protein [Segetibacter sp.]
MTFNYYPQFFTATILEWKQLLVLDSMKQIITSSLQYLYSSASFYLKANSKWSFLTYYSG